jgi:hypothetical protein
MNVCRIVFRNFLKVLFHYILSMCKQEPGYHSRYSDWLRAGPPKGRSSSPGRVKNFLFSKPPDRLWSPPNLLSNGHPVLFLRG